MMLGSTGEYTRKFAGSAGALAVGFAAGEGIQIFLLPDFVHFKLLPPMTFLAPSCVQGAPLLITAASAKVNEVESRTAISTPENAFLMH